MEDKVINPSGINYETMAKLMLSNCIFVYNDESESRVRQMAEFMSQNLVIDPVTEDLCNDCFITPEGKLPSLEHLEARLYIPKSMSHQIKNNFIFLE